MTANMAASRTGRIFWPIVPLLQLSLFHWLSYISILRIGLKNTIMSFIYSLKLIWGPEHDKHSKSMHMNTTQDHKRVIAQVHKHWAAEDCTWFLKYDEFHSTFIYILCQNFQVYLYFIMVRCRYTNFSYLE